MLDAADRRLSDGDVSGTSVASTGEKGGLGGGSSKGKEEGGNSGSGNSCSAISCIGFPKDLWLVLGNDGGGGLLERMTMGADSAL